MLKKYEKWQEEFISQELGRVLTEFNYKVFNGMPENTRTEFIAENILPYDDKTFRMEAHWKGDIVRLIASKSVDVNGEIIWYTNDHRVCLVCGKTIIKDGYYNEGNGDYYCSKDCLTADLNECYGEKGWRLTAEENSEGGYVNSDKEGDLFIYWTEWEDDEDGE